MNPFRIKQFFNERKTFTKQVLEKYSEEIDILEQVYDLGNSLTIKRRRRSSDNYRFFKEILQAGLVRTVNRIQSIASLLMLGCSPDAALILRTIIDETINILYIEKEPILRSFLYLRHGSKERIEIMKRGLRQLLMQLSRRSTLKRYYILKKKCLFTMLT